jgi:hypothetical protein
LQLREQLLKFPRVPLDSSSGRCYFLLEAAKTLFYIGKTSESLELVRLLHPLAGEDLKSEALIEGFYEDLRLEDQKRAFLLDRARADIANLAGQRLPQSLLDCLGRVMRVIELDSSHRTWTTEQLQNIQQALLDHEAQKIQVSTLNHKLADVTEQLTRVDADLQISKTEQSQAKEESKHIDKAKKKSKKQGSDEFVPRSRSVYSYLANSIRLFSTDIDSSEQHEITFRTHEDSEFEFLEGCKLIEYAKGALICCGGRVSDKTWTLESRNGFQPAEQDCLAVSRGWHGLVEFDKQVFAIGGSQNGSCAMKKVEVFDTKFMYWSDLRPMKNAVSHVTPVVLPATKTIYVMGGRNGHTTVDRIQTLDTEALAWRSELFIQTAYSPFCFKASCSAEQFYFLDNKSVLYLYKTEDSETLEVIKRIKMPSLDLTNSVYYYQGSLYVSSDQGPAIILAVGHIG